MLHTHTHKHTHASFLCHGVSLHTHMNTLHHLWSTITKWPHLFWQTQWSQRFHAASSIMPRSDYYRIFCSVCKWAQKLALTQIEGWKWGVQGITKQQLSNTISSTYILPWHYLSLNVNLFLLSLWKKESLDDCNLFDIQQLKITVLSQTDCRRSVCFASWLSRRCRRVAADCEQSVSMLSSGVQSTITGQKVPLRAAAAAPAP